MDASTSVVHGLLPHKRIGALLPEQRIQFGLVGRDPNENYADLLVYFYHVRRFLGKGAYGVVFLATPRRLPTELPVALKFQFVDPDELVREASIQRMLTETWARFGADTQVVVPMLKVYDYTPQAVWGDRTTLGALLSGSDLLSDDPEQQKPISGNKKVVKETLFADDRLDLRDSQFITGDNTKRRVPDVNFSLLVGEVISSTWDSVFAEFGYWPNTLAQTLLAMFSMQHIFSLVHGDLHGHNVALSLLSSPITLQYNFSHGKTMYVKTDRLVKLADFGLSWIRVPRTLAGAYGLAAGISRPGYSSYHLQRASMSREYRPWQDPMRLGAYILQKVLLTGLWQVARNTGLLGVIHSMLSIDVDPAVPVGATIQAADSQEEQRREGVRHRMKLLDRILDALLTEATPYKDMYQDTLAITFFIFDAVRYVPIPHIIQQNWGFFGGELKTTSPTNGDVYDMTLAVGNHTTALYEWPAVPAVRGIAPEVAPDRAPPILFDDPASASESPTTPPWARRGSSPAPTSPELPVKNNSPVIVLADGSRREL